MKILRAFEVLLVTISFAFFCIFLSEQGSQAASEKYASDKEVREAFTLIQDQQNKLAEIIISIDSRIKKLEQPVEDK